MNTYKEEALPSSDDVADARTEFLKFMHVHREVLKYDFRLEILQEVFEGFDEFFEYVKEVELDAG